MKKVFIFLSTTLLVAPAFACLGEAQIIARIDGVQLMSPSACFVRLDPKSVSFYRQNQRCPLDLAEVLSAGVEVGLRREDVCSLQVGDSLNGVIFKDVDGTLRLERN